LKNASTRRWGRQSILRATVDPENDPDASSLRSEDAAQLVVVAHGQVSTAGSPRERDAHGIEPGARRSAL
jgi:hypothetical protein